MSVYDYVDFRQYLRETLSARKAENSAYSLTFVAQRCGGVSKAQLSLILAGKRSLRGPLVEKLGTVLGLSNREQSYFAELVGFNQATTASDRERHLEHVLHLRPKGKRSWMADEQYQVLRNWHCMLLRELIQLPDFDPTPAAIRRKFKGRLSEREARAALAALVDSGLVKRDSDGKYAVTSETIESSDDVKSLLIQSYHRSCLELGKSILETEPVAEREFGSVNLVLDEAAFAALRRQLKTFQDRATEYESLVKPGEKRRVCQLNVQFFTVTE